MWCVGVPQCILCKRVQQTPTQLHVEPMSCVCFKIFVRNFLTKIVTQKRKSRMKSQYQLRKPIKHNDHFWPLVNQIFCITDLLLNRTGRTLVHLVLQAAKRNSNSISVFGSYSSMSTLHKCNELEDCQGSPDITLEKAQVILASHAELKQEQHGKHHFGVYTCIRESLAFLNSICW